MSEQNEQLPLTRRERRMREMGETGAMDLSEVAAASAEETPDVPPTAAPPVDVEVEISPVNEDGTPRSRREMRQLREAAIAAAALENQDSPADQADADVQADEDVQADADQLDAASSGTGQAEPVRPEEAQPEPDQPEEAQPESAQPEDVPADPAQPEEVPAEAVQLDTVEGDSQVITTETVSAEIIESEEEIPAPVSADSHAAAVPDFDTLIAPPTEPFTVEELREASRVAEQGGAEATREAELAAPGAETPEEVASADDAPSPDEAVSSEQAPNDVPSQDAAVASKPKRRFPWNRNKAANEAAADSAPALPSEASVDASIPESAVPGSEEAPAPTEAIVIDETEVAEIATETVAVDETDAESDADAAVIEDLSVDAEISDATPTDRPIVTDNEAAAAAEGTPENTDSAGAPVSASPGYSFPDIVPPEEWRSVFDDPAARATQLPSQGAQAGGDFDDLISRAVAQEGASASSNTSALILPAMPDDTGGLSGPLGGTGELYLTGSIELPKSLGETGGHSSLHDSIEMDPIMGQASAEAHVSADHGPAPVSARHAVSARVPSSIPVVAKPTKERSKLPLVLSLTGGGLLVAVVGLGVWGASNGMFG